jgi:hypothetical protein
VWWTAGHVERAGEAEQGLGISPLAERHLLVKVTPRAGTSSRCLKISNAPAEGRAEG